ncbi:Bgt-50035 [Blumeria graminis f. sp. tritici]|uniref:Bgt-50035 n=1 Tax=Blumeria graminis f. sp. tritici TaxID=62690 RepID=A0A9X9L742_BLUGR|nr:Bgt-50035 [Blumeria graminis f. sp. tritici]
MKFFTISGISTLLCILAPVQAFVTPPLRDLIPNVLPVPDPNREFRFHCPNGPIYSKAQVMKVVLFAKKFIRPDKPDDEYPFVFTRLNYNVAETVWYYPMAEGPGPHDFVVFNTDSEIVGLNSRTHYSESSDVIENCEFEYLD